MKNFVTFLMLLTLASTRMVEISQMMRNLASKKHREQAVSHAIKPASTLKLNMLKLKNWG